MDVFAHNGHDDHVVHKMKPALMTEYIAQHGCWHGIATAEEKMTVQEAPELRPPPSHEDDEVQTSEETQRGYRWRDVGEDPHRLCRWFV